MRHAIRIGIIWVIVSVILILGIAFIPIPSPTGSEEAEGIHQTMYMLFYVGAPIFAFVWVLLIYGLVTFHARGPEPGEYVPLPETNTLLFLWAGITFVIVLFMAGWGTFTLHEITQPPAVAAQGQSTATRSHPGATSKKHQTGLPAGAAYSNAHPLNVQVIGQQWLWTFRYPSFGGFESRDLVLPINGTILFHITSLDVVHSFWIYQDDVKEDAVPGVENTAWMRPRQIESSTTSGKNWVTCNELCGLWHGYMIAKMDVTTPAKFKAWATHMEASEKASGLLKNLPPYAPIYYPQSNANFPPAPQDQSP